MAPAITKPRRKQVSSDVIVAPKRNAAELPEVLTLAEASSFLRLPPKDVILLATADGLPGRQVGDEWRFLKSSLEDWLRSGPAGSGNQSLLARVGSWKDDPDIDSMLEEIYRRRGRSMVETIPD